MGRMPAEIRRLWSAPLCALVGLCALSGCFNPLVTSQHIVERFRTPATAAAPNTDVVTLEIAVLALPITDRAGPAAIWASADEQIVPADQKARLEDNGLRIGVVGGIPPAALLGYLTSDKTNPDPHHCLKKTGDAKVVTLGGTVTDCKFDLIQDGASKPMTLESAACSIQVTPIVRNESVVLQIVPQIQHGKRSLWPGSDGAGGWAMQGQKPIERFSGLQVDVPLGNSEYLIVGSRDKADSLGRLFFRSAGERPTDRLLVVRISRTPSDSVPIARNDPSAPLAAQAAGFSARGVAP
jgi:hypothetical protein